MIAFMISPAAAPLLRKTHVEPARSESPRQMITAAARSEQAGTQVPASFVCAVGHSLG